ncbi:uncharacterized protein TRAVEDRAFT_31070 [Trametes versicolor FP-101664 SS1]|uniref:uncharacterized protein n=1 Tax=Trametes versicolor (strain FP-101664) TaxID=717944 RepID=UPI00046215C3|nr:uncharacterized protein TRAVEDRAFT_31070 [Trametes versicolor FP-101664 SS1]EIW55292.1 hypothetical protein TRAVEDRAFT_31070 [Trametes versicolor FP-101664 SS1]
MASWVLAHPPWHALARVRLRWDVFVKPGTWTSKQFLSTPPLSAETPAMREVKTYPYPATAPDTTLFEETTDEYYAAEGDTQAHTGLYPSHAEVNHPSTMLENLVKERNYADATRVHAELLELGVEIPFHPVYHFAARQALLNPALSQRERLESFVKWWSLFPPRREVREPLRAIGSVLTDLLRNDAVPDIPLIVRFALLAASKGYARAVYRQVIPVIASYAPSDVLLHFLGEFLAAVRQFKTSIVRDGKASESAASRTLHIQPSFIYGITLLELVRIGKTGVALEVLQLVRSRGIRYHYILCFLREEADANVVATVMSLCKARQAQSSWLETPAKDAILPSWKPPSSPTRQPETVATPSLDPLQSPTDDAAASASDSNEMQALVTITRSLKHALSSGTLSLSSESLQRVLAAYRAAGRSTLLRRLRVLAYRHHEIVPTWALAEMVNHDHCHRSLYTIMEEFESHFYLVGVPRGFTDELWKARGNGPARNRPQIHRKYFPTAKHTHFVWRVFLARARGRAQVERLYLQLLEDVAASRDIPALAVPRIACLPSWKPATDPAVFIRPIPPPSLFGVGHFAIFMKAFDRLDLPKVAARVIIDMYSLGFGPDSGLVAPFLSSLRYLPSDHPPTKALDFFEKALQNASQGGFSAEQAQSQANSHSSSSGDERDTLKTRMLAFVYGGVMRRLLLDGRDAEAVEVARRFVASVPPLRNPSRFIEEVLREPVIACALASEPESMSPVP